MESLLTLTLSREKEIVRDYLVWSLIQLIKNSQAVQNLFLTFQDL